MPSDNLSNEPGTGILAALKAMRRRGSIFSAPVEDFEDCDVACPDNTEHDTPTKRKDKPQILLLPDHTDRIRFSDFEYIGSALLVALQAIANHTAVRLLIVDRHPESATILQEMLIQAAENWKKQTIAQMSNEAHAPYVSIARHKPETHFTGREQPFSKSEHLHHYQAILDVGVPPYEDRRAYLSREGSRLAPHADDTILDTIAAFPVGYHSLARALRIYHHTTSITAILDWLEPVSTSLTRPSFKPSAQAIEEATAPKIQICTGPISPTASNGEDFSETMHNLTTPLPLLGRAATTRNNDGSFNLTNVLRFQMPWMDKITDQIETFLAIQEISGRPWFQIEPICIDGPAGIGKSHYARLLAELSGARTSALDVGGSSDNTTLEGTPKGFTTAQPAWPLMVMSQHSTANPILLLDEIDKAGGSDQHGRVHQTLLSMTEPVSAAAWYDRCLLISADLSHINWLFTSNDATKLPSQLASRIEVIQIDRPSPDHFPIALDSILETIAARWKITPEFLPTIPPAQIDQIYTSFRQHRSIRLLGRHVRKILGVLVTHQPNTHN